MANRAGITCEIIYGQGKPENPIGKTGDEANHSWNAVKLDGKWYLCDPTWSSGYTDIPAILFIFDYDDSYFLMDPVSFAKTHTPLDEKWTLVKNSNKNKIIKG